MKITKLDTYFLSVSLPQPVRISTATISQVSEVIVKLTTDAGLVGIGEAHGPFLFRQAPDGLRAVNEIVQRVTPLVVGEDPFNVERIWQDLFALSIVRLGFCSYWMPIHVGHRFKLQVISGESFIPDFHTQLPNPFDAHFFAKLLLAING